MKKYVIDNSSGKGSMVRVILLTMKLLTILIFAATMTVSASVYSQKTKIDLQLQNSTVGTILKSIESRSEFIFFYDVDLINARVEKSISVRDANISTVLEELFGNSNIAYFVDDRQIFLYKKDDISQLENLKEKNRAEVEQQQKKELSGSVKDLKGFPLPGVTVVAKGTTVGTISDNDGNFRLSVPVDAKTIVFSFVGMKTQEVTITGKTSFKIVMEEEAVGLDDVVVVGYGFQKKESVVGAITQVSSQALIRSGNSNVTNAIAGKLSGVLTIQQSGEPGANNSEIIIRGLSSWNGSAPLVLVDGVERDFNSLDPNEINTISVLKDASATAVFGAKGANGVIIVTTKRGKIGKPQLDFSASYGLQKATMIPDHIDSYTTMSMLNTAYMNNTQYQSLIPDNILMEYRKPSTPLNALRYPNVNWFDELTRQFAPTINANFNVSGGTNFVKYFCSLGYLNEGDFFSARKEGYYDLNYHYNRFNYRTNVDFQLTKSTTLSFNLGGETGIKNSPNSSPWRSIYYTGPSRYPTYFPAWVLDQVPDPDYPNDKGERLVMNFGESVANPYSSLHSGQFNQNLDSKLFTDLVIDQKLDFVTKGLSFAGKIALSTYYRNTILTANPSYPQYQLNYEDIGKPGVNPWFRSGQGNEYYQMAPLDINVGGLQSDF